MVTWCRLACCGVSWAALTRWVTFSGCGAASASWRDWMYPTVAFCRRTRVRTLRVRRGPFSTGEGTQDVFVIRGARAVKTSVTFGLTGFDYYEVTNGLMAGDEVIISDMREYQRLSDLRIR